MTELPPDVRDRAAREVHALVRNGKEMPYADAEEQRYYELVATRWLDAVAEVLAAEQPKWMHANIADCAETEREVMRLQARVTELEGALRLTSALVGDGEDARNALKIVSGAEIDALKARVAELSTEHLHLSNEVEALEEWNFWLSRTLRDMARRATSLRRLTDFAVTAPEPRTEQAGDMAEELERTRADLLHDVGVVSRAGHEVELQLHARVDLLTTALTGVVEANDPHGFNAAYNDARAVLSAAPTESETP